MRRIVILTFIGLMPLACRRPVSSGVHGSGVPKTETRQIATFDEIDFRGAGSLEIAIGQPQSLIITCDDNILPLIETKVTGHQLVVRPVQQIRDVKLVIKATVADLKNLQIGGAAKAQVTGIANETLDITANGAATISLAGKTDRLQIEINGAGKVSADELAARDVRAEISGTGEADVNASKTLNATINGVGTIRYTGNPQVTKQINGLGTVSKRG